MRVLHNDTGLAGTLSPDHEPFPVGPGGDLMWHVLWDNGHASPAFDDDLTVL